MFFRRLPPAGSLQSPGFHQTHPFDQLRAHNFTRLIVRDQERCPVVAACPPPNVRQVIGPPWPRLNATCSGVRIPTIAASSRVLHRHAIAPFVPHPKSVAFKCPVFHPIYRTRRFSRSAAGRLQMFFSMHLSEQSRIVQNAIENVVQKTGV